MERFTVFISGALAMYSAAGWTSNNLNLAEHLNQRTRVERARLQFTDDELGRLRAALQVALAEKATLLPSRPPLT